ncbi:MAG: PAS domain S-box protein [Chloroflexi bacterium]|nr:PAS domain S-box protein [Chloroflexota bacterium]
MVNRRLLADVKAQEEKFTTAFHSSPYAIILIRMSDGIIFEVNDSFVNTTGYQYAEINGKTILDMHLWVREEDRLAVFSELAQGRDIHGVEYQFHNKAGEVLTGLFSANLVTINSDKCILASIGDITQRKRAEEKVRLIAAEWQTTFDSITDLVSIQDKNSKLIRVNKAYAATFQKKPEELAGSHCYEVVHKTSCPIDNCPHEQALKTKTSITSEIFESGLGAYLEVTCSPIFDEHGDIAGTIHIVKNITGRKKAEETLARSEERYRTILNNMQDSYFEVDLAGNFTFVNEATCRNLGYKMEELIGQNFSIIAPGEDEVKAIVEAYNEVYKRGEPHTGFAFKVMRKDGSTGYAETSISLLKDEQGRPIGFRSVGRDVTERKKMEQQLLEVATHDALTGLPNRTLLYDRCGIALANAQRNHKKVVIMSLDLDFFKNVNDMLGHDMGDRLLIAAAGRLTGALRKSDTVARMGGDEFVLLLWEVDDPDDAVSVAEKILEDFRQPFLINGHSLNVTVSIGIAIYPENGDTMEELLKSSDKSLYTAKESGRDRFAL